MFDIISLQFKVEVVSLLDNQKIVDKAPKVNPEILETLKSLGYSSIEIKSGRIYARRRNRDHISIGLSKKGNPSKIRAHQDFLTSSLPLSHHHADFTAEKRLTGQFRRAFNKRTAGWGTGKTTK
jgi:hypothetical protein